MFWEYPQGQNIWVNLQLPACMQFNLATIAIDLNIKLFSIVNDSHVSEETKHVIKLCLGQKSCWILWNPKPPWPKGSTKSWPKYPVDFMV